ncbi:hypothetical protein [Bacteroides caccae]|uniref:Apea-like HEPN domain-containing protein n=1 Tax=Bacteroides caccae TaxID=47678 RepID=A0A6A1K4Y4_9BACE|nr:hypothetical protein [Bacteroides caccae]KAA5476052.1 hypothetical protein F2Y27_19445 [Bacteroides caccae]KAA5486978.1 hypothetical protein F2Y25_16300 [Bacteroides caccae]KAA5487363.1 hypothetical protein F2Y35_19655 [Bacteroides caccae]KAA5501398.1 hypothetical protein F2Y47_15045 [Bacteroides caccae]
MWKIPNFVVTPNLEEDIERLLSKKILELYLNCEDGEKRNRIRRITEMLDLIDHLLHFSGYLISINKPTKRVKNGKIYIDDHISFNGHDYSGCEYDIGALVYYLYVSIIDTSMAKTSVYIKFEDFFNKRIKENCVSKMEVLSLCKEYNELYGLSKNFQDVFVNRISSDLKTEFVDNVLVLNDRRSTNYTKEEVERYWGSWQKKSIECKMKKIAICLYSIRSSYTHSNIRYFIPSRTWSTDELQTSVKYLVHKDVDLLNLFKKVILELCEQILN